MTETQKLPCKEVFLVLEEISSGDIIMAEGLLTASNYYFDGLARTHLQHPPLVTWKNSTLVTV